ncbi:MAG: BMP family ABC transporter substrate-binding protein, partial [Paracoccus sp. (in: a-proteobacteria)]|nr:BMP family ABC transporter substrate-binding protein [Paracoccus sp. (in: a-proteobacteria)]
GGTGAGVLQAAADGGILSIGVDSNQNHLHPGQVLTSVVKRVDNAVYDAFMAGDDVSFGVQEWNVSNDGVSVAMDEHNEALVTPEMEAAVEEARAAIASGELSVHDYMTDNTCPVQ